MKRGYVDAPQGQIHYAEAGSGSPVVLYPNRPRSWGIYRRLAGLLADRHRVVVLDPPGCGGSDPIEGTVELADLSATTLRVMDALGIGRAHVSGHHTGATVAVDLAARHADRVLSIAPCGFLLLTDEEKARRLDGSLFSPAAGNPPQPNGAHLLPMLKKFPPTPPEDLAFLNDWMVDNLVSEAHQAELARAVYRYDEVSALGQVTAPTLFVQSTGPGEPPFLQRMDKAHALVPGSRLAFIEGGDIHFIHHRAAELAPLLLELFAGADASAGAVA
ncbi:MAG TPA: alpha/beta hydrolase [Mycobacteriales bacterium]|jgi:pimeloyl-ACP methyl ester carboxylesterase|nr:alpha/beta hydrolase [Mycobacteriales bacterium]